MAGSLEQDDSTRGCSKRQDILSLAERLSFSQEFCFLVLLNLDAHLKIFSTVRVEKPVKLMQALQIVRVVNGSRVSVAGLKA
jgi:hypothetical protein